MVLDLNGRESTIYAKSGLALDTFGAQVAPGGLALEGNGRSNGSYSLWEFNQVT